MLDYLTKNARLPVVTMTIFLIVYTILTELQVNYSLLITLFIISQITVPVMVWKVLRVKMSGIPNLDGREFGYMDRPDITAR